MSETAQTLIGDALQEILVNSAEQSIEAADFQTSVRYLNRLMAQFDADGISLGYTEVSSPNDAITIPAGAINAVIYNLAVNLSTAYNVPINAVLIKKADDGMKTLSRLATQGFTSSYPSTLPIGSGNEGDSLRYDRFYNTDQDETVGAETGGFIETED